MRPKLLIGIDEAGRGPLAGPVAVAAFAVHDRKALKRFAGVKDSKQLTPKQREGWFEAIQEHASRGEAYYSVSFAMPGTIDSKGLTRSISAAIGRCLSKLESAVGVPLDAKVLLDGLLHAPKKFIDQRTIIGGDESEPLIALASICAKVSRDRRMAKLAKEFPGYGFEIHKGYGTRLHYEAIGKLGLCDAHRRRFLKGFVKRKEI